ncbi:PREDICTED: transcription factor E4F1, partial [Condylura cristata]|uniref:transcription factor E4F1 n=1 Tax=Condylura cristata TaxID=143302 RepID=UPI000643E2DF
ARRLADEDDVHRCGRCQAEFTALEGFVQHKLQRVCQRAPQDTLPAPPATLGPTLLGRQVAPAVAGREEPITVAHIVVEAPDVVGKRTAGRPGPAPGTAPWAGQEGQCCPRPPLSEQARLGRVFSPASRRQGYERPYKCAKCGKSFRESGALTRHLKSLTPCTEKIRFGMSKDVVVVGEEDAPAGPGATTVGTVTSPSVTGEPLGTPPVIHLVTDAKGTVLHEVHVQMQELPLGEKGLAAESPGPEALPCPGEAGRENLLRQAMQNSGIALEPGPPARADGQPPAPPLLGVEQVAPEVSAAPRTHPCPQCSETFPTAATLEAHKKGHAGGCGGYLAGPWPPAGGCLLEVEELLVADDSPAAVLAEDPHTVLVEFSSVVADTQEYIIEAASDDAESGEAAEVIQGAPTEVDSHIMKVVRQIVHQASAGHQIIVQNVTMDQEAGLGPEAAAADTITIATPESLTEQVAMTLASAISEGTVLTARAGASGAEQATVTMVSSEDIEILEHAGELVIASPEGQLEVQTVIV